MKHVELLRNCMRSTLATHAPIRHGKLENQAHKPDTLTLHSNRIWNKRPRAFYTYMHV